MLAGGKSCAEVARALGLARQTVSGWKNVPHFRAELTTATQDTRDALSAKLFNMTEKAVQIINGDLHSDDKYGGDRRLNTSFRILQLMAYSRVTAPDPAHIKEATILNVIKRREEEKVA